MKTKITEQGLLIPKSLFEGVDEVEIRQEQNTIVIVPIRKDPVLDLGKQPVIVDVDDASISHDTHLYPV